jgi:hypothetical protein
MMALLGLLTGDAVFNVCSAIINIFIDLSKSAEGRVVLVVLALLATGAYVDHKGYRRGLEHCTHVCPASKTDPGWWTSVFTLD